MGGYLRRVRIDIHPMSDATTGNGVLHRMRVAVDSSSNSYALDVVLTEDDFTSRFDWVFEHCLRTLKRELARETQSISAEVVPEE